MHESADNGELGLVLGHSRCPALRLLGARYVANASFALVGFCLLLVNEVWFPWGMLPAITLLITYGVWTLWLNKRSRRVRSDARQELEAHPFDPKAHLTESSARVRICGDEDLIREAVYDPDPLIEPRVFETRPWVSGWAAVLMLVSPPGIQFVATQKGFFLADRRIRAGSVYCPRSALYPSSSSGGIASAQAQASRLPSCPRANR